jgi:hypothetical protein
MTDLTVAAALDHLESGKFALRAENNTPGAVTRNNSNSHPT